MRVAQQEYPQTLIAGEEIRVALARRRWSQAELARRCEVTDVFVSRRLSGQTPITLDELAMFADALDMPVRELLPRLDSNQQHTGLPMQRTNDDVTDLRSWRSQRVRRFLAERPDLGVPNPRSG